VFVDEVAFLKWADKVGVKVCNCSECGLACTSDPFCNDRKFRLGGRIKRRPLCTDCIRVGE
jgi:hypothetical protein